MIHKKILIIIIGLLILDSGVYLINESTSSVETDDYDLNIVVTIPPQREFVREIGGDRVKITLMVPPGQDPHSYEPRSSQMREVAKADIYYKVGSGIEFEKTWMGTLKEYNEDMKIINGAEGIELIEMGYHDEEDHGHGEEDLDPHIWLSPKNALKMVDNLVEGMIETDPDNEDFYIKNAEEYKERLRGLDSELENDLSRYRGEKFLVFHPSFGYLAHDYDLEQVPIQEQGKEPGTKGLENIIKQAEENNISVIFVSPQFDESNAETIAEEIDGEVVILNPLDENYLDNMRNLAEKLVDGFRKGGS